MKWELFSLFPCCTLEYSEWSSTVPGREQDHLGRNILEGVHSFQLRMEPKAATHFLSFGPERCSRVMEDREVPYPLIAGQPGDIPDLSAVSCERVYSGKQGNRESH